MIAEYRDPAADAAEAERLGEAGLVEARARAMRIVERAVRIAVWIRELEEVVHYARIVRLAVTSLVAAVIQAERVPELVHERPCLGRLLAAGQEDARRGPPAERDHQVVATEVAVDLGHTRRAGRVELVVTEDRVTREQPFGGKQRAAVRIAPLRDGSEVAVARRTVTDLEIPEVVLRAGPSRAGPKEDEWNVRDLLIGPRVERDPAVDAERRHHVRQRPDLRPVPGHPVDLDVDVRAVGIGAGDRIRHDRPVTRTDRRAVLLPAVRDRVAVPVRERVDARRVGESGLVDRIASGGHEQIGVLFVEPWVARDRQAVAGPYDLPLVVDARRALQQQPRIRWNEVVQVVDRAVLPDHRVEVGVAVGSVRIADDRARVVDRER